MSWCPDFEFRGTCRWLKPDSDDQVYMRFNVEVNGMYGPYQKCNPGPLPPRPQVIGAINIDGSL